MGDGGRVDECAGTFVRRRFGAPALKRQCFSLLQHESNSRPHALKPHPSTNAPAACSSPAAATVLTKAHTRATKLPELERTKAFRAENIQAAKAPEISQETAQELKGSCVRTRARICNRTAALGYSGTHDALVLLTSFCISY
jgi:hypothetical protein